jgi:RNA-directed DNA polymerase
MAGGGGGGKGSDQEECDQPDRFRTLERERGKVMTNSKRAQIGKPTIQPRGNVCSQPPNLQNWRERIRQSAQKGKEAKFTSLWHHVYDIETLREAYFGLKRKSAPGMDGETWKHYGMNLEENLQDLSGRLRRGAYKAKPVTRVYIPKGGGKERPIGIPVLEDKIVQRATVAVLNCIYEVDFKNFSYGFRLKRNPHQALDALAVAINTRKVSWVLDADIRGFFDAISHEWMMKFMEHRIADERVLRHIKKWLNAGVLEDGVKRYAEEGTPQGGSISPLLANIYLHYVLDLWVSQWRKTQATGELITVRFADDFVVGFQYRKDGQRFMKELKARLQTFNLELNESKTRLIEFGRFATENAKKWGEGKPKTFDFLGFRHICDKTAKGNFVVLRETRPDRMQRKLKDIKLELKRRMHQSTPEVGKWLRSVLRGHYQYFGVPRNNRRLSTFRHQVMRLWWRSMARRSQRQRNMYERMKRLTERWLPQPTICHPYPEERLCVIYSR